MRQLFRLPQKKYNSREGIIDLATYIIEIPPRNVEEFIKLNPRAQRVLSVETAAKELIDHVTSEHGISSYNDFTCQYMRNLASSINYFPNSDPGTII